MSAFTRFRSYAYIWPTARLHKLTAPLVWEIGASGSGWFLEIPAGTEFDVSTPHGLGWAVNPFKREYLLPAAIHDELLRRGHDPAFASSEFRRALRALGVGRAWAWCLFGATLIWTSLRRWRK